MFHHRRIPKWTVEYIIDVKLVYDAYQDSLEIQDGFHHHWNGTCSRKSVKNEAY